MSSRAARSRPMISPTTSSGSSAGSPRRRRAPGSGATWRPGRRSATGWAPSARPSRKWACSWRTTGGGVRALHAGQPRALRGVPRGLPVREPRVLHDAARGGPHAGHRPAHLLRALDHARGAAAPLRHPLLRRGGPARAGPGGRRARDRGPALADAARRPWTALRRKDITLRLPTIKNLELVQSGGTRADRSWPRCAAARCPPSAPACCRWTASPSRSSPAIPAGTRALVLGPWS